MAVELKSAEDKSLSLDSSGWTRTRVKVIEGSNFEEIFNSGLLPERGSSHPENTRFRLDSASCEIIGNADRRIQVLWSGTYVTRGSGGGAISSGGSETVDDTPKSKLDPWDLGAQNLNVATYQVSQVLRKAYNMDGEYDEVDVVNSAKVPLTVNGAKWGREITFTFCKRDHYDTRDFSEPIINERSVEVAGIKIKAGDGLLFPFSRKHVTDRDDYGNKIRDYYEYSVRIRAFAKEWEYHLLDMGTLIRDAKGDLQNIYRYKAWENGYSDVDKAATPWTYGGISDVLAAKKVYAGILQNDNKNGLEYWNKYQELPYEAVTEPLPLNESGGLDLEAMKSGKYRKINVTQYQMGSWSSFGMPSDEVREDK
jgi:hypothetical protein